MTSERYLRIRDIFHAACECDAGARAAYIEKVCANDLDLRSAVVDLLNTDKNETDFLGSVAASGPEPGRSYNRWEAPGAQIGHYTLARLLGEGGFGRVYLAEQKEPVARRIALKILKLGMDTRQVIARFEQERQALALMDHPNIAKVLDAGTTDNGRPYFVMEFVNGSRLTDFCDSRGMSTNQRLELFKQICSAVHHAHQKGIIHRDLKPSNILIAEDGATAMPKIIDFGIAKALGGKLTEKTLHTEERQLIGTPAYMSPEQAAGSGQDIDTRTDVYSLGVLLYELLAGVSPFDTERLYSANHDEIRRIVCEEEPLSPSRRVERLFSSSHTRMSTMSSEGQAKPDVLSKGYSVSKPGSSQFTGFAVDATTGARRDTAFSIIDIARQRHTDPTTLCRQLRQDLDWIVMKCLEKDRERRFSSAVELSDDIERHLRGEPVRAAPPSAAYRARKLLRRHRTAFIAGTGVAFALLIGTGLALYGLIETKREQRRTAEERDHATQIAEFMEQTLAGVGPSVARGRDTVLLREMMDTAAHRINAGELRMLPEAELRLRAVIGETYREIAELDSAEQMLRPAMELARSLHPTPDADLAEALRKFGTLLSDQGHYQESEKLAREELSVRKAVYGDEHPRVATNFAELGLVLMLSGRLSEAEASARTGVEMHQRLGNSDPLGMAKCLGILGGILEENARIDEAEAALREALRIRRETLDKDDWQIASSVNNLALLVKRSSPTEAESLYREAIEGFERALGPEHPQVATALNNFGHLLRQQQRLDEAEPLFERALAIQKKTLGPDHPHLAFSLDNLATVARARGRLAEAEALYRELVKLRSRLPHTSDVQHAQSLNALSLVLKDEHKLDEAEVALRKASEYCKAPGDRHEESLALILHHLADVLHEAGRDEEAIEVAREAVDIYHAFPVRDRSEHAHALLILSELYLKDGRDIDAEPLLEERLAIIRKALPALHPATAAALVSLGGVRMRLDRPAEAEKLLKEAVEIREQLFPDGHAQAWEHYDAMSQLGDAVRAQADNITATDAQAALDEYQRAEKLLLDAHQGLEREATAPPDGQRKAVERIISLYQSRSAAQPGAGYDQRVTDFSNLPRSKR